MTVPIQRSNELLKNLMGRNFILEKQVNEKLKMIKIICRHELESGECCNTFVASTNGVQIFVKGKLIPLNPRKFYFDCPNCHRMIKWHRRDNSANSK